MSDKELIEYLKSEECVSISSFQIKFLMSFPTARKLVEKLNRLHIIYLMPNSNRLYGINKDVLNNISKINCN